VTAPEPMGLVDETERTKVVVANQRSYVVPLDVAAEIERLKAALAEKEREC
jgi:hypothetical protein